MHNETFTIVDTKDLQIKSLLDFAEVLGYVPVDKSLLSRGFYQEEDKDYVSLEDLIIDHNVTISYKNKLVQQVKLQRDKSQPDGVKCQNHMVQLTPRGEELYAHLRSL